jgi:hypothetical protein
MSETSPALRERRRSGLTAVGCIVWALLFLGVYTAWKFVPALLNGGRIQRNVEYALKNMPPQSTEEEMRLRIVSKGSAGSIQFEEKNVSVTKEVEEGRRIFHISVVQPTPVSYLGKDLKVMHNVDLTYVIEVDEVALARQREYERQRKAAYEAEQRKARAFADRVQSAYDECEEQWGEGNCTVTETYGGDSNELVKLY